MDWRFSDRRVSGYPYLSGAFGEPCPDAGALSDTARYFRVSHGPPLSMWRIYTIRATATLRRLESSAEEDAEYWRNEKVFQKWSVMEYEHRPAELPWKYPEITWSYKESYNQ